MNNNTYNFRNPTGDPTRTRTGRPLEYASSSIYPSTPAFPRFSTPPQPHLGRTRGAYDPYWGSTEPRPLGIMSLPLQAPSRLEFQVLNNMPPQTQEDHSSSSSRLRQQDNALKKLRKEIYNPIPKRISSRLCLYYRDQASKIVRDMEKEKEEEGKRCAICLEDFEIKEMVMLTPCNHMFHEECIVPWVKSNGQCPVCRASIWDPTAAAAGRQSSSANNNMTNVVVVPNNNGDLFGGGDLISILRAMGVM